MALQADLSAVEGGRRDTPMLCSPQGTTRKMLDSSTRWSRLVMFKSLFVPSRPLLGRLLQHTPFHKNVAAIFPSPQKAGRKKRTVQSHASVTAPPP